MKIPKIKKLPSGAWNCRVRVNGTEYSITDYDKDKVYAQAVAYKGGIIKAKHAPERITVREAIKRYVEDKRNLLSPATLKGYAVILRNRFPSLMDANAATITLRDIQRAVNAEAAEVSAKTVRNAVGLLKPALRDYTQDIDWRSLRLPARQKHAPTVLEADELARLFAAIRGTELELAVLLAAWLGLRRSEILALTPADFDRKHKTVAIRSALVQSDDAPLVKKDPKTFSSARVISCPDYILALVPEEGTERVCPRYADYYRKALRRVCKAEGLPICGMHDLRHTNASVMLSLNIADKYAMERGGWSSNATMKNIYQHTMRGESEAVGKRIDAFFTPLSEGAIVDENGDEIKKPSPQAG